jgi:hypothetical protein
MSIHTLFLSFLHLFPVPQEANFENSLESFKKESSIYFHATARSGHATDAMFDLYYKSMLWELVLAKQRHVDCVVSSQRAPLIIEYDLQNGFISWREHHKQPIFSIACHKQYC